MDVTSEQVSRASALLDEDIAKWRNRPVGEVKILFADATYVKVRRNGLVVSQFPEAIRKRIRTNNIEENLNRQIKRRTNLITVFPNENSMLRLVASICMEISQEWEAHAIYLDVRNL